MSSKPTVTPTYLICPRCLELLTRDDLEGFGRCSYCDHQFEFDSDLEDFLLRPVVQQWVRQTRAQTGFEASR